jgi:hypothetical protein
MRVEHPNLGKGTVIGRILDGACVVRFDGKEHSQVVKLRQLRLIRDDVTPTTPQDVARKLP